MHMHRIGMRALQLCACAWLLFAAAHSAAAHGAGRCDVNGDRVIDALDLALILAAGDRATIGPDDPRDADGNGTIDVRDWTACRQLCTRPPCSTRNIPPTAHAGRDQSVPVGAVVRLLGASSTDPDGPQPLAYAWTMVSRPAGSTATLAGAATIDPAFVVDVPGTYRVRLTVDDGAASSAPDEVVVSTVNSAPVADAGPDQRRRVGEVATLIGSASYDPDGDPLSYAWQLVAPAESYAKLSRPTTATRYFVIDVPGTYRAYLTVADEAGLTATDVVVVTTTNAAPVANAGPDQSVFVGDAVVLNGTGSTDVDGDPLTFAWVLVGRPQGSTAVLANAATPSPGFVVDKAGTYSAQLVVNDGAASSVPDTVVVTTGNTAPVANPKAGCAAAANVDCSVPVGTPVGLDGSASTDVDGNALSYAWSLLARPPASAAVLATPSAVNAVFTTDVPGAFIVQLIVNDGTVSSVPRTLTITSTNVRPTAVATINPVSISALPRVVQLDGSGSTDPEGQGLTYAWSLAAKPPGSAAALVSVTSVNPTFTADLLGTYIAQLIVSDGYLASVPATVTAATINQAPSANAGPDQTLPAGSTVQLTSAGSADPEGAPLGYFWSLLAKPAGSAADFNDANTAAPTFVADRKGTFVAQLIVNDGVLSSLPDTVQVTAANRVPVAVADGYAVVEDGALSVGGPVGVLANDVDADGDALTAIIVGATPAGLAFNASGSFTYTPPANFNGTTTFQYKANDGAVDSAPAVVTITVTAVDDPPVANAGPNQNLPAPGVVQLDGAASADPEGQPLTFAWTLTSMPPGSAATLNSGAIVNPTFSADLGGTYVAQLIVADGVLSSPPASVSIVVAPVTTVTIVATDPAAAEAGLDPGVFTVTRTGSTTLALSVNYAIGGTASNNNDYVILFGQVVIPPGQSSATITISPIADGFADPDETVILTLSPSGSYVVGTPNSATVTIH